MGSVIFVYGRKVLTEMAAAIPQRGSIFLKIMLAALLGAFSPLTLHGVIPILAALLQLNVGQPVLAAFIVSSVLINPNLFIYSLALGSGLAWLRLGLGILAGIGAGGLTWVFARGSLLEFKAFTEVRAESSSGGCRVAEGNFLRGLKKTAPHLGLGIILAALIQVYFPKDILDFLFKSNRGLSVLYAASLGVPTYYCGGGTIPLIGAWLTEGMSLGSAVAYMITGPATKLTNLTAVKILMPGMKFWLFVAYCIGFGIAAGLAVDFIMGL